MTYLCGYYFLKHYIKKFSPVAPERSLPVGMESANCGIHQFLCNYLLSAAAVSINTTHYIFIQTMVLSRTAPLPQIASLQPAPWPGLPMTYLYGYYFFKTLHQIITSCRTCSGICRIVHRKSLFSIKSSLAVTPRYPVLGFWAQKLILAITISVSPTPTSGTKNLHFVLIFMACMYIFIINDIASQVPFLTFPFKGHSGPFYAQNLHHRPMERGSKEELILCL